MAGLSNYLERALLGHLVGRDPYTSPATTVFALYTVAPTDTGGGTEVSGNGYVRQPIVWAAATTDGSFNTHISNSTTITFPTATANWGTIVAGAIFDTAGTPNFLWWGPINPVKTIYQNDIFVVLPSNSVLGLD